MTDMPSKPTRPDPIAALTGRLSNAPYPSGMRLPGQGGKFTTCGAVQRWPGNTFVRHVDRASAAYQGLVAVQERMKLSPFGTLFTWLPAPSFHLTVFQGLSPGHESADWWPTGLRGLTRDETTVAMRELVEDVALQSAEVRSVGLFGGNSLTIEGAGETDETRLRRARQDLRSATGINPPDFDRYVFHITLGYLVQWLTEDTARNLVAFSDEVHAEFARHHPRIPLGPCELCDFDSMHHFEPVVALGEERG